MDHAKTLAKIEAYAATLAGGTPGNPMWTSVHINIRFLRWAIAQGFEDEKSAYTQTVTIPCEQNHVTVLAMVNPLVGKFPVDSYLMSRHPLGGDLNGHRVDAQEATYGFALMFRGSSRNMIAVDENQLDAWLATRRHKVLAKLKDGSFAFTLTDPGEDVNFRLLFNIG